MSSNSDTATTSAPDRSPATVEQLEQALATTAEATSALRGAEVGDLRMVKGPTGLREWEVLKITYPERKGAAA